MKHEPELPDSQTESINIMEESEKFMNELYKMSKEFTRTDKVFFNVKEEDGIVQEIEFRDLTREVSWKRPTSEKRKLKDQRFNAIIIFTRQKDWSAFKLATYYKSWEDLKSHRPFNVSSSKTGYSQNLSNLLKEIQWKIKKANTKRIINGKISATKNQLADTFTKEPE